MPQTAHPHPEPAAPANPHPEPVEGWGSPRPHIHLGAYRALAGCAASQPCSRRKIPRAYCHGPAWPGHPGPLQLALAVCPSSWTYRAICTRYS